MGTLLHRMVAVAWVVVTVLAGTSTAETQPSSPSTNYHLVLGEGGGYARLMTPPPSLSTLTLSAWVNVTNFPHGVAPILTVVSPDAKTQTAFFLRHDGLGVLWGGPVAAPPYPFDQVDRHPRTQWKPVEVRKKRDAVDYSGGLGDIINILADSRRGRSYDTWTPYGFVDVDQMGVEDLEASPSSGGPDSLHILPVREGYSRSESYNDWTNVPYELTMLESDPYERHLANRQSPKPYEPQQANPEPRIITQPSGDDDFVIFNWNVPSPAPKQTIPQSPLQWSPMGTPKQTQPKEQVVPATASFQVGVGNLRPLESINSGSWSSHVTAVNLGDNSWTPQQARPVFTVVRPPRPVARPPTTTTTPRPTTTTQRPRTEFLTTHATTRGKPTSTAPRRIHVPVATTKYTPPPSTPFKTTSIPYSSVPTTSIPIKITSLPFKTTATPFKRPQATLVPYKGLSYITRRFTAPPTTQPPKTPISRSDPPRHGNPPSRQVTRMPLWKLIKNPSMAQHHSNQTTSRPTSNSTPIPTTHATRRITTPRTTTPRPTTTTTTTTTSQPPVRPVKTTPTSTIATTTRPVPRRTTTKQANTKPTGLPTIHTAQQGTSTVKPHITGQKSKVSIWTSGGSVPKQNKNHGYQEKHPAKTQQRGGILNAVNKHRSVEIMPYHVDEFHRAMNRVPLVKDGDTAVVYSIPITNVEAFNAMYQHYQEQETFTSSSTPAAVVHAAKEDETNENQLGTSSISTIILDEGLTTKYTERPEPDLRETLSPGIIKEDEAVLPPTEEPLPPTPSRSDIPVSKEEEEEIKFQPLPTLKLRDQDAQADSSSKIIAVTEGTKTKQTPTYSQTRYTIPDFVFPSSKAPTILNEPNAAPVLATSSVQIDIPISSSKVHTPPVSDEADSPTFGLGGILLPKPLHLKLAQTINQPTVHDSGNVEVQATPNLSTLSNQPQVSLFPQVQTNSQQQDQSSSFAIIQVNDRETSEYLPIPADLESDAVFSVDELYSSPGVLSLQDEAHPAGHYQAPAQLYHEQLPPHYLTGLDLPRPISLPLPASRPRQDPTSRQDEGDDIVFSADPDELIKQGLLPHPVHYVSTPEEAQEWMQDQYSSQEQIKERVFTVDGSKTLNAAPHGPVKSESLEGQDFNFKKVPYSFNEDQWYHLAFTWSAEDHQTSVFVNGQLVGTLSGVMLGHGALSGGGLTVIGQTLLPDLTDFDSTSQFVGEISDINIWGHTLGEESVQALYRCGRPQISQVLNWKQLSMRFYNDVYIEKSETLCGA